MANVIKIKRGNGAPTSAILTEGELGFDLTNHDLYIGNSSSVIKIGTDTDRLVHKSGDTMTGILTLMSDQYADGSGALDLANSNIINVNSIYTNDLADNANEGISFYRDSSHFDTLWINNGDILFSPNRALNSAPDKSASQKVARFTADPTTGQLILTDGTTGGIKALTASNTDIILPNANINIQRVGRSMSWHKGRDGAIIKQSSISGYSPIFSIKTKNGSWDIGVYDHTSYTDDLIYTYVSDTKYSGSSASYDAQIKFLENGHIVAALDGNATSATSATNATYVSSSSYGVGNSSKPVYFSGGKPVAISGTIGGTMQPIYINSGTITAGSAYSDFVVDQGITAITQGTTTEHWIWRKWNSGVSECWGKFYISIATSAWSRILPGNSTDYTAIEALVSSGINYPSNLFITTTTPNLGEPHFECSLTTAGVDNYGLWCELYGYGTNSKTPSIYAVRPAWYASDFPTKAVGVVANMRASGRWKT